MQFRFAGTSRTALVYEYGGVSSYVLMQRNPSPLPPFLSLLLFYSEIFFNKIRVGLEIETESSVTDIQYVNVT